MKRSTTHGPSRLRRRLVLGTALLLALAVTFAPRIASVHAQESATPATKSAPASKSVTITGGKGNEAKIEITDDDSAAKSAEKSAGADAGSDTATPGKGSRHKGKRARITVDGDSDYDSFDAFAHDQPMVAAMVFLIVAVIFLAPVLAIGMILWYRFRKQRMLNETMLKLAEKGVVQPAEALGAIANGKAASAMQSAPAVAPIYAQAQRIRKRAAWSDLRKGVLIGGVGLALTFYSMLADREPNGFGLVLLFVGVGFVVLWWFEERHLGPPGGTSGPGSPGATGNPPPAA